jgi:predicted GNAT family acetyltransferase
MVTLPQERDWALSPLGPRDLPLALDFLAPDPLGNVYLISRLQDEGTGPKGQTILIRCDGVPVALASLSTNVVLAGNEDVSLTVREEAMVRLGERILVRMTPVRAIISDARLVDPLWKRIERHLTPPTVIRLNQPVYAISPGPTDHPDLTTTRYATERDLQGLVPACAAMHLEEVGINPLERDAVGYRQRVRELIERKRSLVMTEGGRIVFKCEFSAVTDRAIQIMGVWTAPSERRRGLARQGMAEVCGHILRQGKAVTLFVNDFNAPAVRLYESLGFRQIGTNRALIW